MATVVFGYMAYSYHQNNKKELAVASGALAILFQPFVKLALGRGVDFCRYYNCYRFNYNSFNN